jgi:hypothetical protein
MSKTQKIHGLISNFKHKQRARKLRRPHLHVVPEGARPAPKTPSLTAKYPFYGLLGDLLRVIMPHTEADQMAIASQFLAGIANLIGRGPHFNVGPTEHHLVLYIALVGTSSRARKTTALDVVFEILRGIDEIWEAHCQAGGLSSGEGLIARVRDRDQSGTDDDDGEGPAVTDKRLFVVETELAQPLIVMRRPGNTLSTVLRRLWDRGRAETLVKKNPIKTTDAHVSLVGHITRDELLPNLKREKKNGLANRFLWFFVKRSKDLPSGGHLPADELAPLILRLKKVVAFARTVGEMQRSKKAEKLWRRLYSRLLEEHPERAPTVEKLRDRATAHVMRMACVIALLDMKSTVMVQHIKAAMAMWEQVEASIDLIFTRQNR